jgi:hypothetical protein
MRFLLLIIFFTGTSLAQDSSQPEKESVFDLRYGREVFRIVDVQEETEVWLERTSNLDHFLRMKVDDEEEKIQKISSMDAKKLDKEFAKRFFKCQYELPPSEAGCKVTLRLTMKGEGQDVCRKDDGKTQEIRPFLNGLVKRF